MFQFLKKEKPAPALLESIALFGKLPGIADYTKVNAHLEHAVLVNAEVERMVESLHEQGSASIHSLDMQCVTEQEGTWLVTQICHSQDKSGRAYPFTGVGYLAHSLIKECQPALPIILKPFDDYLQALKGSITSKSDLEVGLKQADALRFMHSKSSLLDAEIALLKQIPQTEWLSQAFNGQAYQAIGDQILAIGKNILAYKKGEPSMLIFPLSHRHIHTSMILWLQWIESLMQPKRWPLNYCMVETKQYAHMYVWFEPHLKHDFNEWVKPVVLPQTRASASPALVALLSRDDLSLCDALYRWQQEVIRDLA